MDRLRQFQHARLRTLGRRSANSSSADPRASDVFLLDSLAIRQQSPKVGLGDCNYQLVIDRKFMLAM